MDYLFKKDSYTKQNQALIASLYKFVGQFSFLFVVVVLMLTGRIEHMHSISRSWLKRLHLKELPSRPVGLGFYGLNALSLSLLKIAGTTADKNWRERKL